VYTTVGSVYTVRGRERYTAAGGGEDGATYCFETDEPERPERLELRERREPEREPERGDDNTRLDETECDGEEYDEERDDDDRE